MKLEVHITVDAELSGYDPAETDAYNAFVDQLKRFLINQQYVDFNINRDLEVYIG